MFKNIIANYIGKIWGIFSVFIFVPFYIKILGIEAYAIINFYGIILTIMYFADGGLSATLNREFARNTDKAIMGNILFTIERVYICICIFIALFIASFSSIIANNWLNTQSISPHSLQTFIILMGLSVAFQLFSTLENSGLLGLEKQVLANGIQVLSSFFRSAVVLIPLYFYPSLLTFFVWQVVVNVLFFFITRYNLWKYIKTDTKHSFDKEFLKTVGKFAGGMMLMAIISSLNTQIDKLVISKTLSLKEFGYYSLAGVLSQSPILLVSPIAVAILPRLVKYSENINKTRLKRIFHINSSILSALATSAGLVLFLFTYDFILIWTHNKEIATTIDNVAKVLILGSVFLSFQFMPYHLAIANGHTKTNIKLSVVSLILIIPTLYYSVNRYGLIGATFTWLALNVIAYLYLGYFLLGKFLKNEFKNWLFFDTILPLIIACIVGCVSYFLVYNLPKGLYVLLYSVVIGIICLGINLFALGKIYPNYKYLYINIFKKNITK
ncbi:oligosaccharide flippase family protein [Pedobacter sp. SL55]|uniref:oligosaccharide flippase family protein n=1 Tax=Pedobacter sp. SL55 TaxID=2995161 RepID=UPI002271B644|nr:oligosaccharide flippase family protein [Pedobacter sp. SL55]WAC41453.1 oligosaccharide flippase family protein [Pedobacter sp. SL55]